MPNQSVSCIATSREQTDFIFRQIKTANFPGDEVSVLFEAIAAPRELAGRHHSLCPEGVLTGAALGEVVGFVLGWTGLLVIPGTHHFLAHMPVIAALAGAVFGAAAGGLIGGLIGLGFSKDDTGPGECGVASGKTRILALAENAEKINWVRKAFTQAGAQEIHTTEAANISQSSFKHPNN